MLKCLLLLVPLIVSLSLPAACAQDYRIGAGDALKITVYEHDDLTSTVRVSEEGMIDFPLIGQVEVAGLSAEQVSRKVEGLLSDGYILNPQVNAFILEYRSRKVVIIGEVNKPGMYDIGWNSTFLELISKAGGLTKDAGVKAIIRRTAGTYAGGDENIITINLRKLIEEGDMSLDIRMQDGDSIHVSRSGVFYVIGEVKKPDSYKYKEGTTVIKAVTVAGGFTDRAATGKIKIIREVDGKEAVIEKVMMDEPVLPEDLIVVPLSFF